LATTTKPEQRQRPGDGTAGVEPATGTDAMRVSASTAPSLGRRALRPWKQAGPLVAWLVAAACGWRMAEHADLLDVVLRAAAVWLAVTVLWLGGLAVAERLIDAMPSAGGGTQETHSRSADP
jgi:hypothetical protein